MLAETYGLNVDGAFDDYEALVLEYVIPLKLIVNGTEKKDNIIAIGFESGKIEMPPAGMWRRGGDFQK